MRLSTNTIYQTGITKISDLQSDQSRLQSQIASGKRILTPSDDPLNASRSLDIQGAQSMNTQYGKNRQIANTSLTNYDISLGAIADQLLNDKTTLVSNAGTLSSTERTVLATTLQASLQTMLGYANAQDAAGNYIYAGYKGNTKPFIATATGATYNGDSNQQYIQVDAQRQMGTNIPGDSLFQAGGNDLFNTYSTLITVLNNPSANSTTVSNAVSTAISNLSSITDTVATSRASVGLKMNELTSIDDVSASRNLEYAQSLSDMQDLDYAQALSDLSQKQTILQAAQKSFTLTTSLSLFDFIK